MHNVHEMSDTTDPLLVNERKDYGNGSSSNSDKLTQVIETNNCDASRETEHATSNFQTFMHLVKGNMGTGILGLPLAVSNAGVVVGPVGLILMAIIAVHCMHLLVTSSRTWCKLKGKSSMSFGDIAEECVSLRYPNKGWIGRFIVNTFLTITQIGFCCIYVVFVARNLQQVVEQYNSSFSLDVKIWIVIILPYFIALSFIKNLNTLSWISLVSNVLQIVGLVCIFIHLFTNLHNPMDQPAFAGVETLPLFFGVAIYAYEGIGVILPLENEMKNPANFRLLLNLSMGLVTCFYVLLGFFGYLMCTDNCHGSITLNLGSSVFATIVKCMISLAIFFTYFIQFYVPMDFLEPWYLRHGSQRHPILKSYCFRAGIVILTGTFAVAIPQLGNFIALIGSLSSSALAIIFPAILHSISCPDSSTVVHIKNIAIAVFGIAGAIFGTIWSLLTIIRDY